MYGKGIAYKLELPLIFLCFPQTTIPLLTLLLAEPEPKRAKKEAFLLKYSSLIKGFSCLSICMMQSANAPIPLAEEAIPEECGKELRV